MPTNFRPTHASVRVWPHPIAFPFYFSLAGRFFKFGMGDGMSSGFFKEETAKTNTLSRAIYHVCISVVMQSFRHHPSASASGISARATSA